MRTRVFTVVLLALAVLVGWELMGVTGSQQTFILGTTPGNPGSGRIRFWANLSSGMLECLTSTGAACSIRVVPYSTSVSDQASVSISAATHGKGTTPVATCLDNSATPIVVNCYYTRAANGDLTFTFTPNFTGTIEVRQ